jgi:hypothetical protein
LGVGGGQAERVVEWRSGASLVLEFGERVRYCFVGGTVADVFGPEREGGEVDEFSRLAVREVPVSGVTTVCWQSDVDQWRRWSLLGLGDLDVIECFHWLMSETVPLIQIIFPPTNQHGIGDA